MPTATKQSAINLFDSLNGTIGKSETKIKGYKTCGHFTHTSKVKNVIKGDGKYC